MGWGAVFRWLLAIIGSALLLMAQVPFESARSNFASYIAALGLDKLASAVPDGADTWVTRIGAAAIAFAFILIILQRVQLSRFWNAFVTNPKKRLVGSKWIFHFNPQAGATKELSFNEDGTIGRGRNQNEARWLFSGAHLDIIRANGDLQNRFILDRSRRRFVSTDESTAKGIRGQFIQEEAGLSR